MSRDTPSFSGDRYRRSVSADAHQYRREFEHDLVGPIFSFARCNHVDLAVRLQHHGQASLEIDLSRQFQTVGLVGQVTQVLPAGIGQIIAGG